MAHREIKFKFWLPVVKKMTYAHNLFQIAFANANGIVPLQYTGQKDKNGKDIFEGDIISKGNFVEFSFGCWNINGGRPLNSFKDVCVIGNIYENPELLQ